MSRKAAPIFYEGIKIIRLSDLPVAQAHLLSGWLDPGAFIILGEKNDFDCVNYEDYDYWFQYYYALERDLDSMI